jgi:hypothetical protein
MKESALCVDMDVSGKGTIESIDPRKNARIFQNGWHQNHERLVEIRMA